MPEVYHAASCDELHISSEWDFKDFNIVLFFLLLKSTVRLPVTSVVAVKLHLRAFDNSTLYV